MNLLKQVTRLVDQLDLRISKVTSTRSFFPNLHHILCHIKPEADQDYIGRGIALNEETAFERAIGEALERYCFLKSSKLVTTNGMALHTDKTLAIKSAQLELLERDAYLCHFYTQTPFHRYSDQELSDSIFMDCSKQLKGSGFSLSVARLRSQPGIYISAAICMGTTQTPYFGFSIGLGSKLSSRDSIDSAIMECVTMIPSILAGEELKVLTKEEFAKIGKAHASDLAALAHNPKYRSEILPFIESMTDFEPSTFAPELKIIDVPV